MKVLRLVAVLLMVPMVAVHAQSTRWVLFNQTDAAVIWVDSAHIQVTGSIRAAWIRWEWTSPRTVGNATFVHSLDREYFDCTNRTSSLSDYILKDAKDSIVGSQRSMAPEWDAVPPESINEQLLDYVCKYKP